MTIEPAPAGPAGGVWRIADGDAIIIDAGGPATAMVPSEAVLLLAVDLPLSSQAKRLAALPFAVEDRVADPIERVHLALGAEIGSRRYLVGVVRHAVMAQWMAAATAAGIPDAVFVPDCLSLPRPVDGWAVDVAGDRALVRSADGTGFALPTTMLAAAWEAAGRPAVQASGDPLPEGLGADGASFPLAPMAERLRQPPLDLRQGEHARRRGAAPAFVRRLAMVAAIAAAAHVVVAAADTAMLRRIADRRQEDLRTLVAATAPGVPVDGDDLPARVADLLPRPTGDDRFGPLLARVSAAMTPVAGSVAVRTIRYQADAITIDLDSPEPGIADRLRAAMGGAGIAARVVPAPGGGLRLTANGG